MEEGRYSGTAITCAPKYATKSSLESAYGYGLYCYNDVGCVRARLIAAVGQKASARGLIASRPLVAVREAAFLTEITVRWQ